MVYIIVSIKMWPIWVYNELSWLWLGLGLAGFELELIHDPEPYPLAQ